MNRTVRMVALLAVTVATAAALPAQQASRAEAIEAAQRHAGAARVTDVRITMGDSLNIDVADSTLTSAAVLSGRWRFGGRDAAAKQVGRDIAAECFARVGASPAPRHITVDVKGMNGASVRLFYTADDFTRAKASRP